MSNIARIRHPQVLLRPSLCFTQFPRSLPPRSARRLSDSPRPTRTGAQLTTAPPNRPTYEICSSPRHPRGRPAVDGPSPSSGFWDHLRQSHRLHFPGAHRQRGRRHRRHHAWDPYARRRRLHADRRTRRHADRSHHPHRLRSRAAAGAGVCRRNSDAQCLPQAGCRVPLGSGHGWVRHAAS